MNNIDHLFVDGYIDLEKRSIALQEKAGIKLELVERAPPVATWQQLIFRDEAFIKIHEILSKLSTQNGQLHERFNRISCSYALQRRQMIRDFTSSGDATKSVEYHLVFNEVNNASDELIEIIRKKTFYFGNDKKNRVELKTTYDLSYLITPQGNEGVSAAILLKPRKGELFSAVKKDKVLKLFKNANSFNNSALILKHMHGDRSDVIGIQQAYKWSCQESMLVYTDGMLARSLFNAAAICKLYDGGDLTSIFEQYPESIINTHWLMKIVKGVMDGFMELLEKDVFHFDLKAENILVNDPFNCKGKQRFDIADWEGAFISHRDKYLESGLFFFTPGNCRGSEVLQAINSIESLNFKKAEGKTISEADLKNLRELLLSMQIYNFAVLLKEIVLFFPEHVALKEFESYLKGSQPISLKDHLERFPLAFSTKRGAMKLSTKIATRSITVEEEVDLVQRGVSWELIEWIKIVLMAPKDVRVELLDQLKEIRNHL